MFIKINITLNLIIEKYLFKPWQINLEDAEKAIRNELRQERIRVKEEEIGRNSK